MRGLAALACTWILQCIVECHFSLEFLSYLWFGATAVSTQTLLRHLSDEHKSQGSHIPHVNSEHVTKHSFPKSLFSSNNVYDDVPLCSLKLFSPLKFFGNFQRSLCKANRVVWWTSLERLKFSSIFDLSLPQKSVAGPLYSWGRLAKPKTEE